VNQSFEAKGIKTVFEIASTRSSTATPQQSQAIAGAMRALQRKIQALEAENTLLKECFTGMQRKFIDLERSHG